MAFQKQLAPLSITPEEENYLEQVANSRTEGFDRVRRARVLLAYSKGQPTTQIRHEVGISFGALSKCIKKALASGIEEALADLPRSGRPAEITPEARTWVVALACTKPKGTGQTRFTNSRGLGACGAMASALGRSRQACEVGSHQGRAVG